MKCKFCDKPFEARPHAVNPKVCFTCEAVTKEFGRVLQGMRYGSFSKGALAYWELLTGNFNYEN